MAQKGNRSKPKRTYTRKQNGSMNSKTQPASEAISSTSSAVINDNNNPDECEQSIIDSNVTERILSTTTCEKDPEHMNLKEFMLHYNTLMKEQIEDASNRIIEEINDSLTKLTLNVRELEHKISEQDDLISQLGISNQQACAEINGLKIELNSTKGYVDGLLTKVEQRIRVLEDAQHINTTTGPATTINQYKMLDLEARSRRRNLLFFGLLENDGETSQDSRNILVHYMKAVMHMPEINEHSFERVHRIGRYTGNQHTYNDIQKRRPIIAAFANDYDKERVLRQASILKGSVYSISQDYPKEIREARNKLWSRCKEARRQGSKAIILYPAKLYINDELVDDKFPEWKTSTPSHSNIQRAVSSNASVQPHHDNRQQSLNNYTGANNQQQQEQHEQQRNSQQPAECAQNVLNNQQDGNGKSNITQNRQEQYKQSQQPTAQYDHTHNSCHQQNRNDTHIQHMTGKNNYNVPRNTNQYYEQPQSQQLSQVTRNNNDNYRTGTANQHSTDRTVYNGHTSDRTASHIQQRPGNNSY